MSYKSGATMSLIVIYIKITAVTLCASKENEDNLPLGSNGTSHEKYAACGQNNTKNISNVLNRTTAASRWDLGLKDFNLWGFLHPQN
jgi:hypothetical protein